MYKWVRYDASEFFGGIHYSKSKYRQLILSLYFVCLFMFACFRNYCVFFPIYNVFCFLLGPCTLPKAFLVSSCFLTSLLVWLNVWTQATQMCAASGRGETYLTGTNIHCGCIYFSVFWEHGSVMTWLNYQREGMQQFNLSEDFFLLFGSKQTEKLSLDSPQQLLANEQLLEIFEYT